MSSTWSDDASTIVTPSRNSRRREEMAMFRMIDVERKMGKKRALIAVVRPESVRGLERRCKTPWWNFLAKKSSVLVTTDDRLQHTIDEASEEAREGRSGAEIVIIASSHVDEINFDVDARYTKTLVVLRCGQGHLFITGDSTFNGVRLDCWEDTRRRQRLYLGPSVRIQIGLDRDAPWSRYMRPRAQMSPADIEELHAHVRDMDDAGTNGKWWHKWRGPIAGILGVAATAGKITAGIKAAAGGVFLEYKFGLTSLKFAAGAVKSSALITAAGPAILLGVGVAAAVYFVPWSDVFSWIEGLFSSILGWICDMFAKFRSWVAGHSVPQTTRQRRAHERGSRRMRWD